MYIRCSICNHKEYYTNKDQLMNDLRMIPTSKHKVICQGCLNKGMNHDR